MRILFDRFRREKEEGLAALRRGEKARARASLLSASDSLFRLARGSTDPALARRRTESARKLLALARRIEESGGERARAAREGDEDGEAGTFRIRERPEVRFADVAGLEDVKEEIRLKLVYPFLHPERAEKFGIGRGGGILLYGPPGTGKTLLAKATAGEIKAEFFTVKPSEILSKWVGEAEKNVERLFDEARSCERSIVFIDEIEALAPRRSENRSTVMARVVPQILAEIEGFGSDRGTALLFIGATNEPWALDPAILRPGRFDEKIYVALPDRAARRRILAMNLDAKPLAPDVDLDLLAERLEGMSGADIRNICRKAASGAFLDSIRGAEDRPIRMADLEELARSSRPSVTPATLRRFEAYRATVGG
ncbi:MAG: ATP-binding protein [Planctomycetes bacterium]|nr:ATP-binding protein [Planctomycetota bacterium]